MVDFKDSLNRCIENSSELEIKNYFRENLEILKISHIPEFETLINKYISKKNLSDLVESAFREANQNPEIIKIRKEVGNNQFEKLIESLIKDENALVRSVVLAYTFEELSKILFDRPELFEALYNFHLSIIDRNTKLLSSIKHKTVISAVYNIIIKPRRTRKLSIWKLRFYLWLNIIEIAFYEIFRTNFRNGLLGFRLAFTFPNKINWNIDGKGIEMHFKNTTNWVNLYQLWNLSFTMEIEDFPFSTVKLLITSVADYQSKPELYLHKRVIALYLYIIYVELSVG